LKKLETILQCNWIFYIIFFFSLVYCFIYINIPNESKYDVDDNLFNCIIDDIFIDGNYLSLRLIGKEKLQANYYFDSFEEKENFIKNYKLGDKILIQGRLSLPNATSNFNSFNYRNYLYYEEVYYILEVSSYQKLDNNSSYLYKLKNIIINRVNKLENSSYLFALILGDNRYIDESVNNTYQTIGISHLFAISGMHVSIIAGLLLFLLKKLHFNDKLSYFFIISFLIIYLFITGCSPSILRAVVLFVLVAMNKTFKLNIKTFNLYLLTISTIIFMEPVIVFKVGFQFSAVVSGTLIMFSPMINKYNNYFSKLLMTSFIAFLVGIPISIYNFYQINIFSFIYNLFFVPFMSFVLFPLTLATFIVPWIEQILLVFINILEYVSNLCLLLPGLLILKKINILVFIIYYVLVFVILKNWNVNKRPLVILIVLLLLHNKYNYIFKSNYILFLDVGQGDCIFIHSNGENILIDTGGRIDYNNEKWKMRKHKNSIAIGTIIPVLKSFGINKIDSIIISHGDADHMGEAINLVENFKVEKVIFNYGEFNELEQNLIKVLDKKKIPYYSCIKELNIDDNKLYFLNNKDYGNENDNSSVIYTELNNHKFLFMGDAGVEVEEDLIEKYNLNDIDVLKVGHHGSKTSSSKEFINEINPTYSIISVGKNNRYGHPNNSVLDNLGDSKIYRTDKDGSIMFKIKKNKLKIETCSP